MLNKKFIDRIRKDAEAEKLLFTLHARQEMANEDYIFKDVKDGLLSGEILEGYPNHQRGACCLVNGDTEKGRPIHIVCTTGQSPTVIITVYEPKPPKFETPLKRSQR